MYDIVHYSTASTQTKREIYNEFQEGIHGSYQINAGRAGNNNLFRNNALPSITRNAGIQGNLIVPFKGDQDLMPLSCLFYTNVFVPVGTDREIKKAHQYFLRMIQAIARNSDQEETKSISQAERVIELLKNGIMDYFLGPNINKIGHPIIEEYSSMKGMVNGIRRMSNRMYALALLDYYSKKSREGYFNTQYLPIAINPIAINNLDSGNFFEYESNDYYVNGSMSGLWRFNRYSNDSNKFIYFDGAGNFYDNQGVLIGALMISFEAYKTIVERNFGQLAVTYDYDNHGSVQHIQADADSLEVQGSAYGFPATIPQDHMILVMEDDWHDRFSFHTLKKFIRRLTIDGSDPDWNTFRFATTKDIVRFITGSQFPYERRSTIFNN